MPDFLFLLLFVALDPKKGGRTLEDRNDGWANYTQERRKKAKHVYVRRETVLWGTRASKQRKKFGAWREKKPHYAFIFVEGNLSDILIRGRAKV